MIKIISVVLFFIILFSTVNNKMQVSTIKTYNLHDPTYQELKSFIEEDKTNESIYSDNYNCYDFSSKLKTNAFNEGLRSYFVYIEFKLAAHGVVAFNTTDRGLIFIEPKNDKEINVAVGARMFSDVILKVGLIPWIEN